jgi:DNA-binding LacI/PurR family transcriptional regulator/signal transduction histidine kinase/AraC-like DNA-binding protein
MNQAPPVRPTIGFLSTWSCFEGTSIDRYTRTLLKGIQAASRDLGCNLLLSCGISLPATPRSSHTAWPVASKSADFLPVGPWNTDGLIIIPDDLTTQQFDYLQGLIDSRFPVLLTTAEHTGSVVKVDNCGGIRQAFAHLYQHGHRRIAFVAGKWGRGGDSAERLAAFQDACREAGLTTDSRLIAYGEHRQQDGYTAMQQILSRGAHFTAVIASNDLSCIGAVAALREAGRRVPEDVAVIGFDDILDARSHHPPLTTIQHPMYKLGYQAVCSLLEAIDGKIAAGFHQVIPTRLVVRQSCGCAPHSSAGMVKNPPVVLSPGQNTHSVVQDMVAALMAEACHMTGQEIAPVCSDLLAAFVESAGQMDGARFEEALDRAIQVGAGYQEEISIWHAALVILQRDARRLLRQDQTMEVRFANSLVQQAQALVSENARQQATETSLWNMETSNRLGLMTAQLLSMVDMSLEERKQVLAQHLPHIGLENILVALFNPIGEDRFQQAEVIIEAGFEAEKPVKKFPTRSFPPAGLYSQAPYQLALLPLVSDEQQTGFVVFSGSNLDACAAITYNLAAALRTSRLYERALLGQQQAEEATRMKSRFLSMVSHELRTPISLIVGLSDLLVREQKERNDLPDETQRDIEQIFVNSQHLARMLGDVLDLSSNETGALRFTREPVDLAEVVHVASAVGEKLASDHGLTWHASCPSSGPWVMGSRTRLRQVVLNLVSNAVKFTMSGSVVLEMEEDGQQVVVSVSDSGIGIQPEDQEKIFDAFYRTERSVALGYGGLGLGLSITKQIIEQHDGTLAVFSPGKLGSGTTIQFRLPISPFSEPRSYPAPETALPERPLVFLDDHEHDGAAETEAAPRLPELPPGGAAPPQEHKQKVVLVVEDDPGILGFHCRLVEMAGCRSVKARNGREALGIMEHIRPDLILMDLMLPVMDGFETLDAIWAQESTRSIPVIILTAHAVSELEMERFNRGVVAVLNKGMFDVEEILWHIENALSMQSKLSSPTQRLVRRAMMFIHKNYQAAINRETIADHVGISADYMTECFRSEFGVTPIKYLNRYRIQQACALLDQHDQPVKEIALAVGFLENAHFTKAFKRETGLTPSAYRRRKQG